MHLDNLFQFIVPLTFLAIWALTSLFNREAQPLPQRMGRPSPQGGPGSGTGAGSGTGTATLRSEALNRDPTLRWAAPTTADRTAARRPMGRGDDEILIIEETRRPASTGQGSPASARSSSGNVRRVSRARPAAPATPPRRPETPAPRPLGGGLSPNTPMAQSMSRPLELNALNAPPSPLLSSDPRDLARTIAEPTRQAAPRASVAPADFRLNLSSPAKLREALLVSEILQPPLALRRRTGRQI